MLLCKKNVRCDILLLLYGNNGGIPGEIRGNDETEFKKIYTVYCSAVYDGSVALRLYETGRARRILPRGDRTAGRYD